MKQEINMNCTNNDNKMIKQITTFIALTLLPMSLTAQTARQYTTSGNRQFSLSETMIAGESDSSLAGAIVLLPQQTNQSIDGFGFALTYSSCYNLLKMTPEARHQLLKKTYSTTEGYGVSYARISLGCNDFSSTEYSLCDTKGPDDDLLKYFRLYKDETNYVIPILKEVLAINPNLKIIAAPWTSPRWMKSVSVSDRTPHNSWTDGHLNPAYYQAYADYFVKFLQTFLSEGISIYAVSPQNEPLNPGNCASLYMPWNEQAAFVQRLAPAIKQAGLQTKIYLFDHNYNYDNKASEQQYPAKIYSLYEGKTFDGMELIVGAAYHNYGGSSDELNNIHSMYPDKELIFTEASIGTWNDGRNLDTSLADNMVNVGLNTVNKHCRAAIVWNFMLDMNRGPNLDGGCQTCFGAVDIANDYQSYTLNSHYYTICHMSAVVKPGAMRIDTKGWWLDGVTYSAFLNPDGTMALVLYNSTLKKLNIRVTDGSIRYPLYVPARAAVSLLMDNATADGISRYGMTPTADHSYYTLQGMKTESITQAGIYLHNGRKGYVDR